MFTNSNPNNLLIFSHLYFFYFVLAFEMSVRAPSIYPVSLLTHQMFLGKKSIGTLKSVGSALSV